MTTRRSHRLIASLALADPGNPPGDHAQAASPDRSTTETTAGWVKSPKSPVLGGDLGTCFDVSVLKEDGTYRMWFSWRPRKSIALVESKDGIEWSKPVIVLGPNDKTDWEADINRPVVIKHGGRLPDVVHRAGKGQVVDRRMPPARTASPGSGRATIPSSGGQSPGRRWP